jgi:4-hydroxy-2-oxoheptanedioate aldolase
MKVKGDLMRKNLLKAKLQSGQVASGVVMAENSPVIIEILALAGFDFIFIDCEHSPLSVETVQNLVTAAQLRGTTPLVRPPMNVPQIILRYMDTGAAGIIIPGMDSKEAAQAAVKAVKYPPMGERGLGRIRAADYGLSGPLGDYVKQANQETMVFGMVESKKGVENIAEILATDGLDGVFIGTNDLSNSLGVAGQTTHPTVGAAIEKILEAGWAAGKPIAGIVRGGETPQEYIAKGYRMPTTSVCGLLVGAAKQFIKNATG